MRERGYVKLRKIRQLPPVELDEIELSFEVVGVGVGVAAPA